jgi:(S)-3,5-dihydroxyphenylglycine transaminase
MKTSMTCFPNWRKAALIDQSAAHPVQVTSANKNQESIPIMDHPSQDAPEHHSRLEVMNFLNEIVERHPDAISFASGRPAEEFFNIEDWLQQIPQFAAHYAAKNGLTYKSGLNKISQYGRTNGIINDLIASHMAQDEGITCDTSRVIVTSGCQEAMDLCVGTLCSKPNDIILAVDPAYIGITGAAARHNVEIAPISAYSDGELLQTVADAVRSAEAAGKQPRLLYAVPTFDNPTGTVMSQPVRKALLAFCEEKRIVILEDNPYGMIRFEGLPIFTLYSQDRGGCVIYCGTFSKTLCPGVRVGFMLLPETLFGSAAGATELSNQLSQAKSFVTVNTSQISQAIVGGVLLSTNGTLRTIVQPSVALYKQKRDSMVSQLEARFADVRDWVSWNVPEGGFFLVVKLPFSFSMADAEACAQMFKLLVMPVASFSLSDKPDNRVRLSFSYAALTDIPEGVARFSRFVHQRLVDHGFLNAVR